MEAPTIHDLVSTLSMTREDCVEGLKMLLAQAIKQEKSEDAGFVRWPDADRLLGWTCIRCNSEVDMTLLRCKCNESPSPWEPILK